MDLIENIKKVKNEIDEKLRNNKITIGILNEKNNNGKLLIIKEKQLQRIFDIKVISSAQIEIAENQEILENGLFIQDLGKWIYNLYNPIKYLYSFYGGELSSKVLNNEEISKITEKSTKDMSEIRKSGACVQRKELDNQPIVNGYYGPMFDRIDYGVVYLRYETPEMYEILSD